MLLRAALDEDCHRTGFYCWPGAYPGHFYFLDCLSEGPVWVKRVIGTWQVQGSVGWPGGYPQPPTLTSWTVCLRALSQSIELLPGSVFLCSSDEAPASWRLLGPPTYWTVCLSGWSHEILLARTGLCQEGSFGQKPDVQSLEGGRHPIQGRDRLQDCFPRVGCVWSLRYVIKLFLFLKHSSFI